ncbi:MAG: prepilin-type N-terminal cleavage/methylation domain-containing protein [Dehalococcoidales bacterium]|nr:prepilin-type N-terminal cleavage/methylation domain-containing protein [Dehalococcoidales bacterium]
MKQKGFTLIELLLAIAVGSLVIISAFGVLNQVVWGTSRTNSQVVSLTDAHQAALSLKKDMQMAQGAVVVEGAEITLNWTDYTSFIIDENKNHIVIYELVNGNLQRTFDENISIVGRNISYVNFTLNNRAINIIITATTGDVTPRSETLEFSVYMRGEGIE